MSTWSQALMALTPKPRPSRHPAAESDLSNHCECWPCCDACASGRDGLTTDTAPGTIIDNTLEGGDQRW